MPMTDEMNAILQQVFDHLAHAARSRHSAMHTAVVATADGNMRTMVLRGFDRENAVLRFNTDVRSPKIAAIRQDQAMRVLAYDPDAKVQIRMMGQGHVDDRSPAADAAWAGSTTFARRAYLTQGAPGELAGCETSGLPEWAEGINPSEEQVAPARANFALLMVRVTRFDWLYLSSDGHRRAQFDIGDDGTVSGTWLMP